jgi:hypothetical protein
VLVQLVVASATSPADKRGRKSTFRRTAVLMSIQKTFLVEYTTGYDILTVEAKRIG